MRYPLLLLLLLSTPLLHAADDGARPDTAADDDGLSVLREHQEFEKIFTVTNHYERAVKVEKTDVSCSCIRLELGAKFLLPGESTTLDVKVSNERTSGVRNYRVWLYLTDPEYAPLEIQTSWRVKEDIAVDLIKSNPKQRPDDKRYRDIYRYIAHVRPDEHKRLRKYIRLSTPDTLNDGLQITPAYDGAIWKFETRTLDPHTVLLIATAKDDSQPMKPGLYSEHVTLNSNHPHKRQFSLEFNTNIDPNAGNQDAVAEDFIDP